MRVRGFGLTIAALGVALGLAGSAGSFGSPGGDSVEALVIQPDGKIVAAGSVDYSSVLVTRFEADGRVDASFGSSGRVVTAGDTAHALAIDPEGRILVLGSSHLFRYLADGRPDGSFGDQGSAALAPATFSALALQPDGLIVVGGSGVDATGASQLFLLERLRADGTPDPGFGSGGVVRTSFQDSAALHALALQADGRIVAAGTGTDVATGAGVLALARYLPAGQLDPSFGDAGRVRTSTCGTFTAGNRVAVSADGRITVAGSALARYLPDGSLDPSFAGGHALPFGRQGFQALSLFLRPDGAATVAGYEPIERFRADGSLDPAFGVDGVADAGQSVAAAALDPAGRIVVAGSTGDFRALRLQVARLLPDGQPDRSFAGRQLTVEELRSLSTADGRLRTIFRADRIAAAALSPDRRRLALVRSVNGRLELDLVGVDGTGLRTLLRSPFGGYELGSSLSWSPNGRRIAFDAVAVPFPAACHPAAPRRLSFTIDVTTRYLSPLGNGTAPSWSPDGRRIALTDGRKLRVERPDGSGRRVLGAGTSLSWSPNGRRVAFVDPHQWIVSMGSDGRGQRRLAIGRQPVWSPDGSLIAYQRLDCPSAHHTDCLRVVRSGGGGLRQLAGFVGGALGPVSWSRDGTRIAVPVWPRPSPPAPARPWKLAVVTVATRKTRLFGVGDAPLSPGAPAFWGSGKTLYLVLRQIPDNAGATPR